jgi:hypothetical protein
MAGEALLTGEQVNTDAGEQQTQETETPSSWTEGLSEELRGNEVFSNFENLDALAQGYLEAQSKQVIAPEKLDDYIYEPAEGLTVDEANLNQFKELAQKSGLSVDQFKEITAWHDQLVVQQVQQQAAAMEQQRTQAIEVLKQDWGHEYETNLKDAQKMFTSVFPEDVAKQMTDAGWANHPGFIKSIFEFSKMVKETTGFQPGGTKRDTLPSDGYGGRRLVFPSMQRKE